MADKDKKILFEYALLLLSLIGLTQLIGLVISTSIGFIGTIITTVISTIAVIYMYYSAKGISFNFKDKKVQITIIALTVITLLVFAGIPKIQPISFSLVFP